MGKETLADQAKAIRSELNLVRTGNRTLAEPRPCEIIPGFTANADGSALVSTGDTRVICTAFIEDKVPPFRRNSGQGWLTAEYGMLPGATNTRVQREVTQGKASGRTLEIQRLIGRSLRGVTDLSAIGENTIWVDCDVIQADGGTRTAAITGAYVAVVLALRKLGGRMKFKTPPITRQVAAVSVGLIEGEAILDLDYSEDSRADVDLNVVFLDDKGLIEVQGTAEGDPFDRSHLNQMLDLAEAGITQRLEVQMAALGGKLL